MSAGVVSIGLDDRVKCAWCAGDPVYEKYHDDEWGVPLRDDAALFALVVLEGFQAGLSWRTILMKRENFRLAFEDWDAERIADYGPADRERLLADAGIIRNRLKIDAAIGNARAYLALRDEIGSFSDYLWSFTGGQTLLASPRPATIGEYRATSPESDAMSADLKRRGFKFVGSTICYAFMQSAGLVDDHMAGCWRVETSE